MAGQVWYAARMKRHGYTVGGQVQGVGFRPFVFRTAERLDLSGFTGNTSDGVRIEVQGSEAALQDFARALVEDLPVLARIVSCVREELEPVEEVSFRIVASHGHHGHAVLVSPDVATCSHCLADMNDPANRRYQYPFTNCTDCGPRYTITRSIPYDRPSTSMSCFPLCPDCQAEYDNPRDRRFHAQPNACPVCGPHVWLTDGKTRVALTDSSPVVQAATALAAGKIIAIKGLGGFHLVCDATSEEAVAALRRRKHRPHKALAVMVPDMDTVRRIALVSLPLEETLLTSSERPIVVLSARPDVLPRAIAPDLDSIGVMLPYTPLHHLLLKAFGELRPLPVLVMTSGNAGGEPIALGNREALTRLRDIADLFLLHNRDILIRADDSVVCVLPPLERSQDDNFEIEKCQSSAALEFFQNRSALEEADARIHFFRRARGYVPRPLELPGSDTKKVILAVGAELKNTLCLTRGNDAFVSQHIGDLKNMETFAFFQDMATHLGSLLEVSPEATVCDLHPDYLSTIFAQESTGNVLRIQHHFAHLYSVLGEHGHTDPALGLTLDGTGYGLDGTIWGGELLLVHPEAVRNAARSGQPFGYGEQVNVTPWGQRLGRLAPFPLPGGEAAIREPWRLASGFLAVLERMEMLPLSEQETVVLLRSLFSPREMRGAGEAGEAPLHLPALHAAVRELVQRATTPYTSSCGRLFDAVAALLGLCPVISYEGQAAIRLEHAAHSCPVHTTEQQPIPMCLAQRNDLWELDTVALFLHLLQKKHEGVSVPTLARRFHFGLAEGLAELALQGARDSGIRTVALSGGVLHNRILAEILPLALIRRGLVPLMHRALPPGDGCIAFGQAVWASLVLG